MPPARLIPETIAPGAFTFTMTALPGTPSIRNAIPMATVGTTPFAAPGLGLIAGAVRPGLDVLRASLEGVSGGHVLISAALSSGALAGITGSASGGMSIALDVLGSTLLAQAERLGVDPALLHRVVAVATGGLDTLPHNGAVITLPGICGMTHRQAYGDIFVVAVLVPILACAAIIAFGMAFGTFQDRQA